MNCLRCAAAATSLPRQRRQNRSGGSAPNVAAAEFYMAPAMPFAQLQARAEQVCALMFGGAAPDLQALDDGMCDLDEEYQVLIARCWASAPMAPLTWHRRRRSSSRAVWYGVHSK